MKLPHVGAPALIGLGVLVAFALGRCTGPGPSKPSRDSTAATNYARFADSVARASARRDSSRNATVDSLLHETTSLGRIARQRLVVRRSEPTPPDTAPQAVAYWRGRAEAAEADLDSVLTVDSVAIAGLAVQFRDQQAETAGLRGELLAAADSIRSYADKLGQKDRRIHALESDRWSLCAAGGVGGTAGQAGTAQGSGPGGAIGGTLLVGLCYRIW